MKMFEKVIWVFTIAVLAFVTFSVVYFPFHQKAEAALVDFRFPEPVYPSMLNERAEASAELPKTDFGDFSFNALVRPHLGYEASAALAEAQAEAADEGISVTAYLNRSIGVELLCEEGYKRACEMQKLHEEIMEIAKLI